MPEFFKTLFFFFLHSCFCQWVTKCGHFPKLPLRYNGLVLDRGVGVVASISQSHDVLYFALEVVEIHTVVIVEIAHDAFRLAFINNVFSGFHQAVYVFLTCGVLIKVRTVIFGSVSELLRRRIRWPDVRSDPLNLFLRQDKTDYLWERNIVFSLK